MDGRFGLSLLFVADAAAVALLQSWLFNNFALSQSSLYYNLCCITILAWVLARPVVVVCFTRVAGALSYLISAVFMLCILNDSCSRTVH